MLHACMKGLAHCREVQDAIKPAQYPILFPVIQMNSSERYHYVQR